MSLSRDLLGKYYETEEVLGKERADWKLGKELLQSRVDLMEAQLRELTTKTAEEEGKITENDKERNELDAKLKELQKTEDQQVQAVEGMEKRVRELWPLLPELLKLKLQAQYDRMPKEDIKREDVKSNVGERFLSVLAVLQEATKFHGDVTVVNERRKLASGKELEVETIYFGLSAAYFAGGDEQERVAGMLLPVDGKWVVNEMPEIAQQVRDVIDMNKSAKIAEFVTLPVEVR